MVLDEDRDRALDRLNTTERDLLDLLGRGHTAKSIAALRSLSEAAVNERFRSARRKTGISSSREIARLIVAQENRHEFIDLALPIDPAPNFPRQDEPHRASPLRWRLPMAAAVILAAAIIAQQTSVPPSPTYRPIPPAAASIYTPHTPSPDLVALRAEVTAGPVDPEWSPATEVALSQAYQDVTETSGALEALDVTCNRSLCEVLGVSRSGLTGEEINALTEAVQAREVNEAIIRMKLENIVQGFSTSEDEVANGSAAMVFVAYWRRKD